MLDAANVYFFVLASLLLLILPGPNMAFVTSHAIAHGWRGGTAAALGISFADLLMTAMVSAGVGAVVMSWAPAFELLRIAGAGYLLWLAWQALRSPAAPKGNGAALRSLKNIFVRGILNSLLNPKALLFFMVFLPQFVSVQNGHVTVQLLLLGTLLATIALAFHVSLGLCAAKIGKALRKQGNSRLGNYAFAAVMAGLAARLLLVQRPV